MIPLRDNLPTDRFPVVTAAIIAINVFVFLFLQGPVVLALERAGGRLEADRRVRRDPVPDHASGRPLPLRRGQGRRTDRGADLLREDAGLPRGGDAADLRRGGFRRRLSRADPPAAAFLTLFTSMFMHGGWLHIIFNMLFLWIFGNNVEDSMGKVRYVVFYLLGGLVAALAQVAVSPDSTDTAGGGERGDRRGARRLCAALSACAGADRCSSSSSSSWSRSRRLVLLGIWILLQFLPAVGQLASPDVGSQGGVAYFAHIGGFLFGLAAIKLFATRRSAAYVGGGPNIRCTDGRCSRPCSSPCSRSSCCSRR